MHRRLLLTTAFIGIVLLAGCATTREEPGAKQALADFARLVASTESADNPDAHLLKVNNAAEENAAKFSSISRDVWDALTIKAYFLAAKNDDVCSRCKAFLTRYPKSSFLAEVRIFWAEASYRTDRYADAAGLFAWLYVNDKNASEPDWYLFKAAKCLYLAGDFKGAAASLDQLLAAKPLGPCSVAAHQLYAAILGFASDKAGASEHLWKYLLNCRSYSIPDTDITAVIGTYILGYRSEAADDAEVLDSYALYALFCSVHNVQEKLVDAICDSAEKFLALTEQPKACYSAYVYARCAYLVQSDFDNEPVIEEWMDKSPDDLKPRFFALRMRTLYRDGDFGKLLEALSTADPRMTADLDVQVYAANSAYTLLDYDTALKYCRMGLSTRPYAQELSHLYALLSIVGQKAADIVVTDLLSGKPVKLSDYAGSNVVLEFWGFGTIPVDPEFGFIRNAQRDYDEDGFKFFSVCLELTETSIHTDAVREEYASRGASWPLVYIADFPVSTLKDHYPLASIPLILILDKNGMVRYVMTRGEELRPAIRRILGQQ